ncbi:MAG TPA: type II secretion system protein [Crocinitomix sp.]|nr:type II secretion system protein [Crocinitomix sp.]
MKSAFTLIELLVVMLLIALVVSVVTPAGYKMYEGILRYIEKKERNDKFHNMKFEAFIRQEKNIEHNISMLGVNYNETSHYND